MREHTDSTLCMERKIVNEEIWKHIFRVLVIIVIQSDEAGIKFLDLWLDQLGDLFRKACFGYKRLSISLFPYILHFPIWYLFLDIVLCYSTLSKIFKTK